MTDRRGDRGERGHLPGPTFAASLAATSAAFAAFAASFSSDFSCSLASLAFYHGLTLAHLSAHRKHSCGILWLASVCQ